MEDHHPTATDSRQRRVPGNNGKLVGPKPPLRPSHVWSIRTKLQMGDRKRDLALFNLAFDSKLRGCDVVALRVEDVAPSGYPMDCATIQQKKTARHRGGLSNSPSQTQALAMKGAPTPRLGTRSSIRVIPMQAPHRLQMVYSEVIGPNR